MMKTPISYYGGKANMAKDIIKLIPRHEQYVEPFFGGGAVFFSKRPSQHEVINDLNGFVTNFYMVLKTDFDALQKLIQGTLHSELHYKEATDIYKGVILTDCKVKRAWAFWVCCNMSFSGKIAMGFAFGNGYDHSQKIANKRDNFTKKYEQRMRKVEIFSRDALALIKLKDGKNTFFYLDPPYVSSECGHYAGYTMDNFKELLELLTTIEGKFLLSSYPETCLLEYRKKEWWESFDSEHLIAVTGKRTEKKTKKECLTCNYTPQGSLTLDF